MLFECCRSKLTNRIYNTVWKTNRCVLECFCSTCICDQINLTLAQKLDCLVAMRQSGKHIFFGHFVHLAFHHYNGIHLSCNYKIDVRTGKLFNCRVDDKLSFDPAHSYVSNWSIIWSSSEHKCCRCTYTGYDVTIVLIVGRHNATDDLNLVEEVVTKQRAYGAIDNTRRQCLLISRTTLALDEAARNLSAG